MTFSLRKIDITCVVIIFTVSLLLGCHIIASGNRQKKQIQQERDLFDQRSYELSLTNKELKQIKDHIALKKSEVDSFDKKIPESANMGGFLKEFDIILKKTGIGLISVNPLEPSREADYTKSPIRIECKGPFIGIYQLLLDLENMERIVAMEKMVIERSIIDQECRVELTTAIFSLRT